MRTYAFLLMLFLPALALLSSCGKNNGGDPASDSRFQWVYNGTTYTARQHAAYTTGIGAPSIRAGLQADANAVGTGPRINLTALLPATYSFAPGSGNSFEYIDDAGYVEAGTAGSLLITANTGTLLSGSFSVTLSNGKSITGTFTHTPIKP